MARNLLGLCVSSYIYLILELLFGPPARLRLDRVARSWRLTWACFMDWAILLGTRTMRCMVYDYVRDTMGLQLFVGYRSMGIYNWRSW